MSHRDPKIKLARNFMSHVWCEREYRELNDFLIPEVLVESPVRKNLGVNHLSDAFSVWFRGFPDLTYKERSLEIIRDRICVHWEVKGNHLGRFLDLSATGKSINYEGTTTLFMFDNIIHAYKADVNISDVTEQISPFKKIKLDLKTDDLYQEFNRVVGLNLTVKQINCLAVLCLRCDKDTISSVLKIKYSTFRTHVDRVLPILGLSSIKDVFDWALATRVLELLINIGVNKVYL